MPRSCYIQLSAIDGSHSLLPSPSLLSSMRRIVAGIYDPLPTPTTVGSRGVTKVAFQNLFREISGLRKRGEKKKRERRRERRRKEEEKKNRVLSPLIARSTGMPSVPPWEQEVNDPRQIAGNATPCLRFPFFFPSTDSFPRPRGTVNGAWMSWMSCLAAETPDVLNDTSNIDTRRSLGQDAWPLLSFPTCLLSFGHIRIRACGGGRSRVMWLETLGEEF